MQGRPSILLIGPANAKGGVGSVMRCLCSSQLLRRRYVLRTIHTSDYKEGRTSGQILLFLSGLMRFVFLSVSNDFQVAHIHASSGRSFVRKVCFFILAKLFRKKVIFHIHSSNFEFYYQNPSRIQRLLIKIVLSQADLVVVLAERWKELLLKRFPFISKPKIRVTRNPVALPLARAHHSNGAKKRVLFMGLLVRSKGIYDIIHAAPRVINKENDAEFVFCGIGPEETELRKRVRQLNIEDHVTFAGWVEGRTKFAYMRKAEIFVLPSYQEGMPIALLEAMSFGLPVISTRVSAIPEIIEEGKNGFLIEPGDVDSLVERICLLLENHKLRAAMRAQNLVAARRFSLKEIVKEWNIVYQSLVSQDEWNQIRGKLNEASYSKSQDRKFNS